MKNILFNPWIGENYGKSELGKLLIIGDSHYFLNNEDESVLKISPLMLLAKLVIIILNLLIRLRKFLIRIIQKSFGQK